MFYKHFNIKGNISALKFRLKPLGNNVVLTLSKNKKVINQKE